MPNRTNNLTDVLLGYDNVSGYFPNCGYMGALIGRVGNRINRGLCHVAGNLLQLAKNDNGNHLHGGDEGFDSSYGPLTRTPRPAV